MIKNFIIYFFKLEIPEITTYFWLACFLVLCVDLTITELPSLLTFYVSPLQAVASKLDLPDDLVGYFSLFLVRESVDGGLTCKFTDITQTNTKRLTSGSENNNTNWSRNDKRAQPC